MKTMKKFLIGISALGLIGCAPEGDYDSFDMTALNSWQRELFVQGAAYWGVGVEDNPKSKNRAFFVNFLDGAAKTRILEEGVNRDILGNRYGGEKFYEVVFKRDVGAPWQDCRTEKGGADFFKASRYEWGYILGNGSSNDPNSPMYNYLSYCGK